MNRDAWRIFVAEVSEVEARVAVRYDGNAGQQIVLRGILRGPYCERAHTLPADYPFCGLTSGEPTAEVVVADPCLWSEELPHLYRIDLEAIRDDEVLDEYHGSVGLKRTSPAKNWDGIK